MKKTLLGVLLPAITFFNIAPNLNNQVTKQQLITTNSKSCASKVKTYTGNSYTNPTSQLISDSDILTFRNDALGWFAYDMSLLDTNYLGLKPAFAIDTNNGQLTINWSKIDYTKLPTGVTKDQINAQLTIVANTKEQLYSNSEYVNGMHNNETNYYQDVTGDGKYKLLTFGAIEKPISLTGENADKVDNYQNLYFQYGLYYIAKAIRAEKINLTSGIALASQFLDKAFPSNPEATNFAIATMTMFNFVKFDACYNFLGNLPYGQGYIYVTTYLILDANNKIVEYGFNRYYYANSYSEIENSLNTEFYVYINFYDLWHIHCYGDCTNYLISNVGFPNNFGSKYEQQVGTIFNDNMNQIIQQATAGNNGAIVQYHWYNNGITDGWYLEGIVAWN